VSDGGLPIVDFPRNPGKPCVSRSTVKLPPSGCGPDGRQLSVVLLFENGDPGLPIVTGVLQESPFVVQTDTIPIVSRENDRAIQHTRESVRVVAENDISLVCGHSSIVLKRDGKVFIKGSYIVSRSSGQHKIKGATVSIN
jgi:hypothetical protein